MATEIKRIKKETEEDRMLNELFVSPIREGFLEVGEDKFVIPIYYEKYRDQLNKLEVRDDDIFITGHPKTGTNWLNEMVYKIISSSEDNAEEVPLFQRTVFLNGPLAIDAEKVRADFPEFGFIADVFTNMSRFKSPRMIKTHLHWSLLPEQLRSGIKKPKILHVVRNPKDVCVSYYHTSKLLDGYVGGFDDFCKLFMAGRVNFGPFFPTMLSYWRERNRPNVLILKYGDMKSDLPLAIKTTAEFLGKPLTKQQIEKLAQNLTFDSMKKKEGEAKAFVDKFSKFYGLTTEETDFLRVGKVGSYKAEMAADMIEKFDEWTKRNLAGTGLIFE